MAESGDVVPSTSGISNNAQDGHSSNIIGESLIKSVGEDNVISKPKSICEDAIPIKDLEDEVRRFE